MQIEKSEQKIKKSRETLQRHLKLLTDEENIEFGYACGFVTEHEFQIMKRIGDKK